MFFKNILVSSEFITHSQFTQLLICYMDTRYAPNMVVTDILISNYYLN